MLVESWLSWFKRGKKNTPCTPKVRRKPRSILLSQDWLLEDRLVLSSSILGNEILVNSNLVGKQVFDVNNDRSMDIASDGTAIVAWADQTKGIVARRIGEDGLALGAEFQVGAVSDTLWGNANVAVYRKGSVNEQDRVVITWTSYGSGEDSSDAGVFGRTFSVDGTPLSGVFRVNATIIGSQRDASVDWISASQFVVSWSGAGQGETQTVFARIFDATGTPVTSEIRVPETKTGAKREPVVISLPNGGFQIAWSGNGPGDASGIFSRQFTSTGAKVGATEFRVNVTTTSTEQQPTMARSGTQVIVAWQTTINNQDPYGSGILARRFGLDGKAQGTAFLVNETTLGNQSDPSIAAMTNGGFSFAWRSVQSGDGIYQREFNPDGTPRFGERLVNSTADGTQTNPTIRAQGPDGYVVVWDGKIGTVAQGIGMQRYGDPLMPTITSDNKKVGDYYEVLYLDPSVPMKTFTLHNSSNMTIYPMLEDANSSASPSDPTIGLYDPYDPLNQEYRGYVGFKDPKTGKFYLGLRPGETFTFKVPLVFWDAGRMHITTDAHYLITPAGIGNPQPNPFKYYDVDPFSGNPQTFDGSIQITNQLPTDTLILTGDQTAKLAIGLSVSSDGGDIPAGTTVKGFEAGQGGTVVHLSAAATFGGSPHKYTFYQPTKRFMEDTSIDGSNGRVMWYHARAKGSGFAEQVGLDAPTQLTEFTIRDPFMGDVAFKTSKDIAASEKISLINYDVSYVDSMVLPVAMETTDAQLYPLQQYKGTIAPGTKALTLQLHYDPKLLVKDLLVTSDKGDLPHGTTIESVVDGGNNTTIVQLSQNSNPTSGLESTFSFTHPTPTAAFGWIGSAKTMAEMQAAIKQFTLGNKPNQNINGLGLYFADENNPDGNGYPQFYNPDLTLAGIKLPSGQNLPGQSPLKADPGVLGPTSNYDSNRFIITSGGTAPIQLAASGSAGGNENTGPNELYMNFPLEMTRAQREDFRLQLDAGKSQWVVSANGQTLPSIKTVGALDSNNRFKVILNGPTNLASGGYSLVFKRPTTDYASTKLANIWYSWGKHYVDSVTKSFGANYSKDLSGTISEEPSDHKPTNQITIAGDVTKLLAPGMVVTTNVSDIFPKATVDDPIVRVTVLDLQYNSGTNSTIVFVSKRPTGRANGDSIAFKFNLPVMLTPTDPGVTTFEMSFTKDAAEAEKFGQSVYQLMEAMSTIKLIPHQGPDWLQLLTNCIGGNIGFIQDIGISVNPQKGFEYKGYSGIANTIRTRIKSVLRGVSDFNAVPENSGKWYPDPSLKGDKTGQLINGKSASYNVLNIDPFVWFVHKQLGLSGYGFSLDDDVADVGANGATKLTVDVGGIAGLPQKAEWTWGATFGPVDSLQGKIETYQSGDANNGLKKITMLDTSPLPVGLQVHGGDPDVGPGALVYGPGIPLGTRVLLPIPFDNQVILDTRVPVDTSGLVGPFNFRGMLPTSLASAVTGKSATLQVIDTVGLYGETGWTYTWSLVDGPNGATANFSSNKTNASKKTSVTVSMTGTYLIRVKMMANDGYFITSDVTVKF